MYDFGIISAMPLDLCEVSGQLVKLRLFHECHDLAQACGQQCSLIARLQRKYRLQYVHSQKLLKLGEFRLCCHAIL